MLACGSARTQTERIGHLHRAPPSQSEASASRSMIGRGSPTTSGSSNAAQSRVLPENRADSSGHVASALSGAALAKAVALGCCCACASMRRPTPSRVVTQSAVRMSSSREAGTPSTMVRLIIGWSSGAGPKSESGWKATTSSSDPSWLGLGLGLGSGLGIGLG